MASPNVDLLNASPADLCAFLKANGIQRFSLVSETAAAAGDYKVRASHPKLDSLARWMETSPDMHGHEGVFVWVSPKTGVLQSAAVHRTCRGQAAGGVRWWTYDTVTAFLTDGLRLARGMTHKNALAGLWWGGGKGVMAKGTGLELEAKQDDEKAYRREVYADYGRLVSSLQGVYVTAEDVGTSVEDMASVFSTTRHTTCIPPELGGSGNPSVPTARGIVCAIEAGLEHLGMGTLAGKSVAVQGLGHVGLPLAKFLAERGVARIVATDIFAANIDAARAELEGAVKDLDLRCVERGDNSVLAAEVDVVSPNATGGVLNAKTIPTIRAPLICGAANNQLADDKTDDGRIAARGLLYVPDFLANRMGIVTCADEGAGTLSPDPMIERHYGTEWPRAIKPVLLDVLADAVASGRTPQAVAHERAESLSLEIHPVYGHRGADIIAALTRSGWADRA